MTGDAVKEIAKLESEAQSRMIVVGDEVYSTRELFHPPRRREDPVPTLELYSLDSLASYVADQYPGEVPAGSVLHVKDPKTVELLGPLLTGKDGTHQRHTYARARWPVESPVWGAYLTTEELLILLQTRFEQTEDLSRLCGLLGNVSHEEAVTLEDDGVTQRAKQRTGISLLGEVRVKNPFSLAPHRSFAEVHPVSSEFVLRIRNEKSAITAALFEADGGAWKIGQVYEIHAKLQALLQEGGLEDGPIILG